MDHSTQTTFPSLGTLARRCRQLPRFVPALALLLAWPAQAQTQAMDADTLQAGLAQEVRDLAQGAQASKPAGVSRVEVKLGQLNPRLRLAPCRKVQPYLPSGTRLWGAARIGLRCVQGPTHWNVYLPITVHAYGPGWVAAGPLAAGNVISAHDLVQAEVNLAEERQLPITDAKLAVGRTLARAVKAGEALNPADLKPHQWFSAGDSVKVLARGPGFSVAGMGQALGHGLEGQPVRVRIDVGRVVTGQAVGDRLVEVPL
jgi:flagellar basal body P-ring formation protein FlgA